MLLSLASVLVSCSPKINTGYCPAIVKPDKCVTDWMSKGDYPPCVFDWMDNVYRQQKSIRVNCEGR